MAIGHAVPLIISFGGSTLTAVSAITLMTLGSAIAGINAGWLVDRYGCKRPQTSTSSVQKFVKVKNLTKRLLLRGFVV